MKTAELIGAQLDWAVAKAEGAEFHHIGEVLCVAWDEKFDVRLTDYSPSTKWVQGGAIIEREKIDSTDLISAMRYYVASKLGEDVTIPEELL